ncbi:MAG TPA: FxSxx-COOH system tetratricopeptide repeat protein [Amycolatopsis sp.]|uniref:FxSxx-COOH system tetratricopeptide repeat protein n=1 Tax=Amycolatopsis sp. TaxID=37632 RepID=UPI002B46A114|nr:FxSxx-COOH system tetratricopeptide repeat protein [Amycolatopsis sp.]HKS50167.1 FxSxx-COOH system tetratricopeptide repeat protein [Amycolatopsis sp.]
MNAIFVNFRNGDDNYAAGMLYLELVASFGENRVFRSTDSLRPGEDWETSILDNVRGCQVFLAVIGRGWPNASDDHGRKRLWQRGDWVRREIALALREGKEVIPVLLHGRERLKTGQLPPSIRELAKRQSVRLDHRRLRADLAALIDDLARRLPAREAGQPPPARATALPVRPSGAVHRRDLLARIEDTMAGSPCPVVVLHGRPGAGKTQLALEYADRHREEHHTTWWVSAAHPQLVTEQLRELARFASAEAEPEPLFGKLNDGGRWLLVLDGADDPAAVARVLAARPDRVLITSRDGRWAPPATLVGVPGFSRTESVALLTGCLGDLDPAEAGELAEALDDLPLAVAQAATFLRGSTLTAGRYRALLATRTGEMLDRGMSAGHPRSLAGAWSLALDSLRSTHPAAAELARLCAFLAAAPVPVDLFETAAPSLAEPLRSVAADPIALDDAVTAVARSGLVEVFPAQLRPHALFQSYLRDVMTAEEATAARETARTVITADHPGDPRSSSSWARHAALLPHLAALEFPRSTDPRCCRLLLDASHYLVVLGDAGTAHDLVSAARTHWSAALGEEHEIVVAATSHLARACFQLGRYPQALAFDKRVLAYRRRVLGPDHEDTLAAAHDVAADAWALSSRDSMPMHEDVVRRRRDILGPDHPDTLRSAHNLAVQLRAAGSLEEARDLDRDTHSRFRRVLGDDHPDTMRSARAVAVDLRLLGRPHEARVLDEDTLTRLTRVFGQDHIETLRCANGLVLDLRALGAWEEADRLDRDNHARLQRLGRQSGSRIMVDSPSPGNSGSGTQRSPSETSTAPVSVNRRSPGGPT